jgi:hypothetical protein
MWCLLAGLAMPLWAKSEPYDPDANEGLPIARPRRRRIPDRDARAPTGHC